MMIIIKPASLLAVISFRWLSARLLHLATLAMHLVPIKHCPCRYPRLGCCQNALALISLHLSYVHSSQKPGPANPAATHGLWISPKFICTFRPVWFVTLSELSVCHLSIHPSVRPSETSHPSAGEMTTRSANLRTPFYICSLVHQSSCQLPCVSSCTLSTSLPNLWTVSFQYLDLHQDCVCVCVKRVET